MNGSHYVWLTYGLEVETITKLRVISTQDSNGEAALESNDGRNRPSVYDFSCEAVMLGNRKLPVRTKNEAVASVEGRKRPAPFWIEVIDDVFEAGGAVNRLAKGVRRL